MGTEHLIPIIIYQLILCRYTSCSYGNYSSVKNIMGGVEWLLPFMREGHTHHGHLAIECGKELEREVKRFLAFQARLAFS